MNLIRRMLVPVALVMATTWTVAGPARPYTASGQGATGTIEGTVSVPWAREATSVVAVYVDGDQAAPRRSDPVLDQRDFRFMPRTLPITVGTTVGFSNSDPFLHNVFSPSAAVKAFNLGTYPRGTTRTVEFTRPGLVVVLCNVHPQMAAFVLVLDTPWFVLTDTRGSYRLAELPEGTHEIEFWTETGEPERQQVTIRAGEVTRLNTEFGSRRRSGWIKTED